MSQSPFIDYYKKHNIIPVNQDLSSFEQHVRRRSALYKMLGIIPALVRDRTVLEFGPGSGDNALYTASLKPEKFVLVDGNPASVDSLKGKVSAGSIPESMAEVVEADILDYQDDRTFDLVLCEGLIPGQLDPGDFTRHIASFAGDGGCVVITTVSALSILAEVCRRMMKPFFARVSDQYEDIVNQATAAFQPHLATLPGMSRHPRDWVQDCILHPWEGQMVFTVADAIDALAEQFDVYGSSPKMLTDWRWYKSINQCETGWNDIAKGQYADYQLSFLDYRLEPQTANAEQADAVDALARRAYDLHVSLWRDDDCEGVGSTFLPVVAEIAQLIQTSMPTTAESLFAYLRGMEQMVRGDVFPDMGSFSGLFGRGQTYLSFIRKS